MSQQSRGSLPSPQFNPHPFPRHSFPPSLRGHHHFGRSRGDCVPTLALRNTTPSNQVPTRHQNSTRVQLPHGVIGPPLRPQQGLIDTSSVHLPSIHPQPIQPLLYQGFPHPLVHTVDQSAFFPRLPSMPFQFLDPGQYQAQSTMTVPLLTAEELAIKPRPHPHLVGLFISCYQYLRFCTTRVARRLRV